MIFPSTVRSGVTPSRSCAPPRPTRKPVITSSKISSAPVAVRVVAQLPKEARVGRDEAHVGRVRLADDRRGLEVRERRVPAAPRRCRPPARRSRRGSPECPAWRGRSRRRPAARPRGRGRRPRTSRSCRGPVTARASRIALIDASVPDEVMRTISADGTRSTTSAASSTSASVGAPKLVPAAAAAVTASTTSGWAWPGDQRAPGHDPVHVAVAVHVDQLGALAARDEDRVAPDRAHRPNGGVHAARKELDGPGVGGGGAISRYACSASHRLCSSVK